MAGSDSGVHGWLLWGTGQAGLLAGLVFGSLFFAGLSLALAHRADSGGLKVFLVGAVAAFNGLYFRLGASMLSVL